MSPLTQPTHRDLLAGRFELRSVLGRGGMSTVWSARDLLLGRDVAIKLLRDDLSEEHAGRIEREARAAARILDPRIVTVLDLHETEDGREHQPETEVRDRTQHRAEPADRFFTEFFAAAAHRLEHVADHRHHPKLRATRRRLRSSEALALIGGTILIVVMLILVGGDDATTRPDEPGDRSTPAAQLDDQLDRIEEIG